MGILYVVSGLVIAAYAVFSSLAIWLAAQLRGPDGADMAAEMQEDGVPEHHLMMLHNYAHGYRLHIWIASVVALVLSLVALMLGNSTAAYWFGIALMIDSWLFMTCTEKDRLLANMSPTEQLVDVAQTLALLAAFMVLAWREIVNFA
jgi:hypothetical protein